MSKNTEKLEYHRLSTEDEQAIKDWIVTAMTIQDNDDAETRQKKLKIESGYKDFMAILKTTLKGTRRKNGARRICYEELPELSRLTGIPYIEFLYATTNRPYDDRAANQIADPEKPGRKRGRPPKKKPEGTDEEQKAKAKQKSASDGPSPKDKLKSLTLEERRPGWSSELEQKMCTFCATLNQKDRDKVEALIKNMLPPYYTDPQLKQFTPVQKIAYINQNRSYSVRSASAQVFAIGIEEQFTRRRMKYTYNVIELNILPYVAKVLDIPIHWLLNLDESTTVLAPDGNMETIMDLFCFLPDDRKRMVYRGVETAAIYNYRRGQK